jgi:hypothetical protein
MGGMEDVGSNLEDLVKNAKETTELDSIYEKAYDLIKNYGRNTYKHTRLYEEREPNGKFLGVFKRSRRTFAVEYDEYSAYCYCFLYRHMKIYDGEKLVFETFASDLYFGAALFGYSKPKIIKYSPGKWEDKLNKS